MLMVSDSGIAKRCFIYLSAALLKGCLDGLGVYVRLLFSG